MQDYPFYYTPKSVKIDIGDVWVNRYDSKRTALITKEFGQTGEHPNCIEVIYFGGHHPEQGDTVIIPRHTFRHHYKPFNINQ